MKNVLLTGLLLIGSVAIVNAQTPIADFETGTFVDIGDSKVKLDGAFSEVYIDGNGITSYEIVDNPETDGLNASNKTLKMINGNGEDWGGLVMILEEQIIASENRYVHIMMKFQNTGIQNFQFAVFPTGGGGDKWSPLTNARSEWFDYVIDLNNIDGDGASFDAVRALRYLPRSANYTNPGNTVYMDEIIINNDPMPRGGYNHIDVASTIADFESGTFDKLTCKDDGGGVAAGSIEVVDNPDATDINTSEKALKFVASSTSGDWWPGLLVTFPKVVVVNEETRYLHIMMHHTSADQSFEFVLMAANQTYCGQKGATAGWVDHVIDLNGIMGQNLASIRYSTRIDNVANLGKTVHFDNIVVSNDPRPRGGFIEMGGVIADFNDGTFNKLTCADDGGGVVAGSIKVVDNPSATGINTTEKALMLETVPSKGQWWAGLRVSFPKVVVVNESTRYLHIMTYNTTADQTYEFNVFASGENYGGKRSTNIGWEDHVIDLGSIEGQNVTGFRYITCVDDEKNLGKTRYIDEIVFNSDPNPRATEMDKSVSIDLTTRYQTIEGFAASDCWTGNFVGQYWNTAEKEAIAKYLFSQNTKADGSPEGIGLSMWRFNLGAGTLEQGGDSGIGDLSRRAESFWNGSGYDWTKQAGQQYFLQQAKAYGCDNFVAFSNSPLVHLTKNGKGYGNSKLSFTSNLKSDKYDEFADYMATVMKHFADEGLPFKYISPVNEPQNSWNPESGQEGSPWSNTEIKTISTALNNALASKGLDTKILLTEAAEWKYLSTTALSVNCSNQIDEFFKPGSSNYIGNLSNVAQIAAGHSYWSDAKNSNLRNARATVKAKANTYGLSLFQSEWCLLSESGDDIPNLDRASFMDIALFMSKVIHSDLTYADVTSWSFWTAMDMDRWGHKNRFLLLALAPGGDPYGTITTPGTVEDRANLWALGNYSFFVRPGYKRVAMTGADELSSFVGSAYISPDENKLVAVYTNLSNSMINTTTTIDGLGSLTPVSSKMYVTSAISKLTKTGSDEYVAGGSLAIPPRSVVTIVYELKDQSTSTAEERPGVLNVYPSVLSAGGTLNIELSNSQAASVPVKIYNSTGQLLYAADKAMENGRIQVQLPQNVTPGMYFLNVADKSIHKSKFIVKESD